MFMTSHISSCLYNDCTADLCLFCRGRYLIFPPPTLLTLLTLPTPYLHKEMTYISWLLIFLPPTIYSMNSLQLSSHILASKLWTSEIFKKWESGHLLARFDLQNNIRSANITSWYTKFIGKSLNCDISHIRNNISSILLVE